VDTPESGHTVCLIFGRDGQAERAHLPVSLSARESDLFWKAVIIIHENDLRWSLGKMAPY